MMTFVGFTVTGTPVGQGSMRSPRAGVVLHSTDKLKGWREAVGWAAKEAMAGRALLQGPLYLQAWFHFAAPKSQPRRFGSKATAPDLDKLLRAIGDALEGIVYANDAQIARVSAEKRWVARGDSGGAYVEVGPR